jgi:hypothetical protein
VLDLEGEAAAFSIDSWQAIVFGMRHLPTEMPASCARADPAHSKAVLANLKALIARDLPTLPPHRTTIDKERLSVLL